MVCPSQSCPLPWLSVRVLNFEGELEPGSLAVPVDAGRDCGFTALALGSRHIVAGTVDSDK